MAAGPDAGRGPGDQHRPWQSPGSPAGTGARGSAVLDQVVQALGDVVTEIRDRTRSPATPGWRPVPGVDPRLLLRLSDAERDAAAEVLREAYAHGRLDLPEFEERLTLVHAARVHGDIAPILADLPGGPPGPGAGSPAPGRGAFGGFAAFDAQGGGEQEVLTAVLREVRRTGAWEVPPRLRVRVRGGSVLLDLRTARVRSELVHIDVQLAGGRIVVIVPDGVPVEVRDGLTVLGSRRDRVRSPAPGADRGTAAGAARGRRPVDSPAAPGTAVVVSGEVVAGQLVVRSPTMRERWRRA